MNHTLQRNEPGSHASCVINRILRFYNKTTRKDALCLGLPLLEGILGLNCSEVLFYSMFSERLI